MQPTARKPFTTPWIALTLAVLVLIAGAALYVTCRSSGMQRAAAATEAPFASLNPGDAAKLVLRLDSLTADGADATNLQKESETKYRCTPEKIYVAFSATTPIVMGNHEDIRPAAVAHVTGVVGKNHELAAEKIVVLTGYVQVLPCK
jgi:hypothetical protein